jgi:hypothetical protein
MIEIIIGNSWMGARDMSLDQAIDLLKNAVKYTGTIEQKHIDLTIVPADKRPLYEKAMAVCQISIKDGKISRDEFLRRVHLEG